MIVRVTITVSMDVHAIHTIAMIPIGAMQRTIIPCQIHQDFLSRHQKKQ